MNSSEYNNVKDNLKQLQEEMDRIQSSYNSLVNANKLVGKHIKLNNTPFANTNPKSLPIVKLIKIKANNPTIVVTELLEIDLNDSNKAFFIALILSFSFSFSCLYLFDNIIE